MPAESAVVHRPFKTAGLPSDPTAAFDLMDIKLRDIRFDVQQRRAVHYVDISDRQDDAFYPDQPHYRQPDRVGARWGPGGEEAPRVLIQKRRYFQRKAFRQVEMVNKVNV